MKRAFRYNLLIFILFLSFINVAFAYEFKDEKNKSNVNSIISEIYSSKEEYEDLAGSYENQGDSVNIIGATSNSYWWPIGSVETIESDGKIFAKGDPETTSISSNFGYRNNPTGNGVKFHSGLDIAGGRGLNETNIIAAKSGVVVYPTADVKNDCPYNSGASSCGGGYGNYVIIQHSDGNYTLYGHMNEGTILVTAGESVEQGQVIGKMGSSGNSTGPHLHFEIREGQNSFSAAVDPLTYISADNPREISSGSGGQFIDWLVSWEGHTPIVGDNYRVVDIGDGVRTVGSGVTLEYNKDKFAKYGIDVSGYPVGSEIPISIVDQIKLEIVDEKRSYVEGIISSNSITLESNQIDALVSQVYNIGNINGFVDNYKRYGNTDAFYNNWFFRAIMRGTRFEAGLTRRRNSEWAMFHNGEYIFNG